MLLGLVGQVSQQKHTAFKTVRGWGVEGVGVGVVHHFGELGGVARDAQRRKQSFPAWKIKEASQRRWPRKRGFETSSYALAS